MSSSVAPPLKFMFYVYLLQSLKDKKLYIGYTNDLRRRFAEHNKGESKSTRNRRPFRLVYYEAFLSQIDAKNRERKLKLFKNTYNHLKKRIVNSLLEHKF